MLENEVTEHKLNKSFQRKNYLFTHKEKSNYLIIILNRPMKTRKQACELAFKV
jgi:hypothetical protein